MTSQVLPAILIAATATALSACSAGQPSTSSSASAAAPAWAVSVGNKVSDALDKASAELSSKDITLSDEGVDGKRLPEAKITPAGDLIIAGKAVALTPAQRADSLAYRKQLVAIARQGMIIGGQGAKLGVNAAGEALAAILSGQSEQQISDRVKAKASGIKQATERLCRRLPALLAAQQAFAAAVPAFRPYATATQKDIDRCEVNTSNVHINH